MYSYSIDDQTNIEKAIILISSKFAMCHNLIKPTLLAFCKCHENFFCLLFIDFLQVSNKLLLEE
jgi:hypothetical protein